MCWDDNPNLYENIIMAARHVDQGRHIVEAHKKRMAEGVAGPNSEQLLKNLENSLAIFEHHLIRLFSDEIILRLNVVGGPDHE